jgi:hypothetical protein
MLSRPPAGRRRYLLVADAGVVVADFSMGNNSIAQPELLQLI